MTIKRLLNPAFAALLSGLVVSGCGAVRQSNWNPGNWFPGNREVVDYDAVGENNPLIPEQTRANVFSLRNDTEDDVYTGRLISTVETLALERSASGAIINVTGLVAYPGAFDVRLVPVEDETDSTQLVYELRSRFTGQGPAPVTAASRRVTVAAFVSQQDLANIRLIRVIGRNNTLQTRR